eukprot:Rmarinus@m.20431
MSDFSSVFPGVWWLEDALQQHDRTTFGEVVNIACSLAFIQKIRNERKIYALVRQFDSLAVAVRHDSILLRRVTNYLTFLNLRQHEIPSDTAIYDAALLEPDDSCVYKDAMQCRWAGDVGTLGAFSLKEHEQSLLRDKSADGLKCTREYPRAQGRVVLAPRVFDLQTVLPRLTSEHTHSSMSGVWFGGEFVLVGVGPVIHVFNHCSECIIQIIFDNPVSRVTFSRDGSVALCVDTTGFVQVWQTSPQWRVQRCVQVESHLAVLSPCGTYFVTPSGSAGQFIVRDLYNDHKTFVRGHKDTVTALCFDIEGSRLFTGAEDTDILVWKPRKGFKSPEARLRGHRGGISSLQHLSDGHSLLVYSRWDDAVRVWQLRPWKQVAQLSPAWLGVGLGTVPLSPGPGRAQVLAVDQYSLYSWNFETVKRGASVRTVLWSNPAASAMAAAYSPRQSRLVCYHEGRVYLWEGLTQGSNVTNEHTGIPRTLPAGSEMACSSDGRFLVFFASDDGSAHLWDAFSGNHVLSLPAGPEKIACVSFSGNSSRLAIATGTRVMIWELLPLRCVREFDAGVLVKAVTLGTDGLTVAFPFSPDRPSRYAMRTPIGLWDVHSGKLVQESPFRVFQLTTLAFMPPFESSVVLCASDVGMKACAFTSHNWAIHLPIELRESNIEQLNFSANGDLIVVCHTLTFADVWRCITQSPDGGAVRSRFERVFSFSGPVECASLRSDGAAVAVGVGSIIRVFSVTSGTCVQELRGHSGRIKSLAWRDVGCLLSSSADGTVRVWSRRWG